jgi:hypothetical protein
METVGGCLEDCACFGDEGPPARARRRRAVFQCPRRERRLLDAPLCRLRWGAARTDDGGVRDPRGADPVLFGDGPPAREAAPR